MQGVRFFGKLPHHSQERDRTGKGRFVRIIPKPPPPKKKPTDHSVTGILEDHSRIWVEKTCLAKLGTSKHQNWFSHPEETKKFCGSSKFESSTHGFWWLFCWTMLAKPTKTCRNPPTFWWCCNHFQVVVSNKFYFHPYVGKIPILTNLFQMGWNHQLVFFLGLQNFFGMTSIQRSLLNAAGWSFQHGLVADEITLASCVGLVQVDGPRIMWMELVETQGLGLLPLMPVCPRNPIKNTWKIGSFCF